MRLEANRGQGSARRQRAHVGDPGERPRCPAPNATKDQLVELCQYVQDTSPVRDSLADPIPVTTTLEIC